MHNVSVSHVVCMVDVCMTCGVHGMWCTLHEELHGFSQHDIDNVRVAWQCSFKTVQTLCFKMALVVHGGQIACVGVPHHGENNVLIAYGKTWTTVAN